VQSVVGDLEKHDILAARKEREGGGGEREREREEMKDVREGGEDYQEC
jgi:hypothetical protein